METISKDQHAVTAAGHTLNRKGQESGGSRKAPSPQPSADAAERADSALHACGIAKRGHEPTPRQVGQLMWQMFMAHPARNGVLWVREIERDEEYLKVRTDGRENLHNVMMLLARSAWLPHNAALTTAGWDQMAEKAGVNRATVARWLVWLREHGYLDVAEGGKSAAFTKRGTNQRATYRLLTRRHTQRAGASALPDPKCDPHLESLDVSNSRARASAADDEQTRKRGSSDSQPQGIVRDQQPQTKRDRLAAAQALTTLRAELAAIGARRLRDLLARFLNAGWSVDDISSALTVAPDGSPWTSRSPIQNQEGWMLFKMKAWAPEEKPAEAEMMRARVAAFDAEHEARKRATAQACRAARGPTSRQTFPDIGGERAIEPKVTMTAIEFTPAGDKLITLVPVPNGEQPELVAIAFAQAEDTKPEMVGYWIPNDTVNVLVPGDAGWLVMRGCHQSRIPSTASGRMWISVRDNSTEMGWGDNAQCWEREHRRHHR